MNPKQATQALNIVAVTSVFTKKAMDELQVHRGSQQKAASIRPDLLNHLLQAGVINDQTKQAAEAMLGSHAETMGLLKSAADVIVKLRTKLEKQAAEQGQGVDPQEVGMTSEKTAADYDSLNDPFVGRKTGKKKASDVAILRVLENP